MIRWFLFGKRSVVAGFSAVLILLVVIGLMLLLGRFHANNDGISIEQGLDKVRKLGLYQDETVNYSKTTVENSVNKYVYESEYHEYQVNPLTQNVTAILARKVKDDFKFSKGPFSPEIDENKAAEIAKSIVSKCAPAFFSTEKYDIKIETNPANPYRTFIIDIEQKDSNNELTGLTAHIALMPDGDITLAGIIEHDLISAKKAAKIGREQAVEIAYSDIIKDYISNKVTSNIKSRKEHSIEVKFGVYFNKPGWYVRIYGVKAERLPYLGGYSYWINAVTGEIIEHGAIGR